MADPQKALESLEKYYASITREQFIEDWERAAPAGESLHDEWVCAGIEKAAQHNAPTSAEHCADEDKS